MKITRKQLMRIINEAIRDGHLSPEEAEDLQDLTADATATVQDYLDRKGLSELTYLLSNMAKVLLSNREVPYFSWLPSERTLATLKIHLTDQDIDIRNGKEVFDYSKAFISTALEILPDNKLPPHSEGLIRMLEKLKAKGSISGTIPTSDYSRYM